MRYPSFPIEDQLIFRLCSKPVDPETIAGIVGQDRIDWDAFLGTIRRHKVAAPVLASLLGIPRLQSRLQFLQERARLEVRAVLHDNRVFRAELSRMVRRLKENNLDCVLLKGLSLDFSGLRYMGDIDLMVRQEDLIQAVDTILRIDGYAYRPADRDGASSKSILGHPLPRCEKRRILRQIPWNNEFQLIHGSRGVMVELHHRPFQPRNPQGHFSEIPMPVLEASPMFWARRRYSEELECAIPAPEHSLILMCLKNAVKHSPANGTFRLSVLTDIDHLVRGGVSWDRLQTDSEQLEAAPFVVFSLRQAKTLLGTPVPASVLHNLTALSTPGQIRAGRLHMRSLTSLRSTSVVYSKLYQSLRPSVYGGSLAQRLYWGSFLPFFLPTRRRIGGFFGLPQQSPLIPLVYAVNPLRWVYKVMKDRLRS